jgi:hypothetical protein
MPSLPSVVLAKPEKYKSSRREDRQVRYIINRRVSGLQRRILGMGSYVPANTP